MASKPLPSIRKETGSGVRVKLIGELFSLYWVIPLPSDVPEPVPIMVLPAPKPLASIVPLVAVPYKSVRKAADSLRVVDAFSVISGL